MPRWTLFFLISILLVGLTSNGSANVFISEFLADVPGGLIGDANGDGHRSTGHDEFVELFNGGNQTVDLAGWSLQDALKIRHSFVQQTLIQPSTYYVVFGGGDLAAFNYPAQTASTGSLNLNNRSDTVILLDPLGQVIDQVTYGREADRDQSLVRFPQSVEEPFVGHKSLNEAGGRRFSPGTDVDGLISLQDAGTDEPPQEIPSSAVPEPSSFLYLAAGGAWWLRMFRNKMKHRT